MARLPEVLRTRAARLFWDVNPDALDMDSHRDFILGRVLMHGDERAVRVVWQTIGESAVREFISRSANRLDARSRRFFELVLSMKEYPWTAPPSPRVKDPLFMP